MIPCEFGKDQPWQFWVEKEAHRRQDMPFPYRLWSKRNPPEGEETLFLQTTVPCKWDLSTGLEGGEDEGRTFVG